VDKETQQKIKFELIHDDQIYLLTNDNLKRAKFVLEDPFGDEVDIGAIDTLEVMIKLDYVDQEAVAKQYISEMPKKLQLVFDFD